MIDDKTAAYARNKQIYVTNLNPVMVYYWNKISSADMLFQEEIVELSCFFFIIISLRTKSSFIT